MKKIFTLFAFMFLAVCLWAQTGEKLLALVIGNADYTNGGSLKNPVNDANLMAKTLKELGFTVIQRTNANRAQMAQAVAEFWGQLAEYNVALFYYAGHGVQVNGVNYLIPVDATLDNKDMVAFEAISVNDVSAKFEEYDKNINIIILDACRNNPFRSWARGGERGFKAINPASGTIIAYATSEGATADDGTGANGLFTEQLVKQLKKQVPIEKVFKLTRVEVERESNGKQSPQEWSKLKGDFYFTPAGTTNQNQSTQTEEVTFNPGNVEVAYGSISIDTEIDGDLYLDNKKLGSVKANSKQNKLNKITTGSHTIEIRGTETYTQTIEIEKDRTFTINVTSNKKKDLPTQFTDQRDGHVYKMVTIGNQTWMAENLAYKADGGCWAYDNNQSNVAIYGYLYDWETAKKSCPVGWHLPSDEEWNQLEQFVGLSAIDAQKSSWRGTHATTLKVAGSSGFAVAYGGKRCPGCSFHNMGIGAEFWSSSEADSWVWMRYIDSNNNSVLRGQKSTRENSSVRCVRD